MAEVSGAAPAGTKRHRLTKKAIQAITPGLKPTVHWDTELKGLGLKVHPTGRAAWIVQYRLRGDRAAKQPVIGTTADMSPEMARTRAKDLIEAARRGVDLLEHERLERDKRASEAERLQQEHARRGRRLTIESAVAGALEALRIQASPKTGRPRSASYLEDQERYLTALAAALGKSIAVEDVDWRAVLSWLKGLPLSSQVQAKAAARSLIAWLLERDELQSDPLAGRWPKARVNAREVTPSPAEVARMLLAAERLALPRKRRPAEDWRTGQASIDPIWRDLLFVIAHTGCRRSEAASIRVEHIDLEQAVWRQPSEVNKARREHLVPLSAPLLARLRAAIGQRTAGLVFPGRVGNAASGWSRMWATVTREAGVDFRLHDLRRALVTAIGETGKVTPDALDQLLNHAAASTAVGVKRVYQRASYLPGMRAAVELWAELLATYLVGGEGPAVSRSAGNR